MLDASHDEKNVYISRMGTMEQWIQQFSNIELVSGILEGTIDYVELLPHQVEALRRGNDALEQVKAYLRDNPPPGMPPISMHPKPTTRRHMHPDPNPNKRWGYDDIPNNGEH